MQTNFLFTLANLTSLYSILTNTNQTAQFDWKFIFSVLKKSVPLGQKAFVKCLGILIHNNLSCYYHIGNISPKVSKGIGMIARLRQTPCPTYHPS